MGDVDPRNPLVHLPGVCEVAKALGPGEQPSLADRIAALLTEDPRAIGRARIQPAEARRIADALATALGRAG